MEELRAAASSAIEWLERMRPVYFAEAETTDRDREKIDQLIEWLYALTEKTATAHELTRKAMLAQAEAEGWPIYPTENPTK